MCHRNPLSHLVYPFWIILSRMIVQGGQSSGKIPIEHRRKIRFIEHIPSEWPGEGGTQASKSWRLSDSEHVNKFQSLQGETWAAEMARDHLTAFSARIGALGR